MSELERINEMRKILPEINKYADMLIKERENDPFDDELVFIMLKEIFKKLPANKIYGIPTVLIKKREMISIMLDFFKSVDDVFYEKAVQILLGQTDRIKINIYNINKVKNFSQKDENNMSEYETNGCINIDKVYTKVYIPTQREINSEISDKIDEEWCTLDDLYVLIHEVSHLFGMNTDKRVELTGENMGKYERNIAESVLNETTAIVFEHLFTDFLQKQATYPVNILKNFYNKRMDTFYGYMEILYTKLMLAEHKKNGNKIDTNFIKNIANGKNVVYRVIKNINRTSPINILRGYALAGILAPTIAKIYRQDKEDGTTKLKEYLESVKKDNLEEALEVVQVSLDEDGRKVLLHNMLERDKEINTREER